MRFAQRETGEQEWMDDFSLGGEQLLQTLDQLLVINYWLGGFKVIKNGMKLLLDSWIQDKKNRPLEIIDLGCGGGDNLIRLAKWLRKRKIPFRLLGVDANEHVLAYARTSAHEFPEIQFLHQDCLDNSFHQQTCDIILCSLFLHHLDDNTLSQKLPLWCKQARTGVLINDLHRSRWAWILFRGITFVFCASAMVRHDGSLSIRRGFVRKELKKLVKLCSSKSAQIKWSWAFRWRVIIFT